MQTPGIIERLQKNLQEILMPGEILMKFFELVGSILKRILNLFPLGLPKNLAI